MNKSEPDLAQAVRHLEEAVSIYPEYAAAWTLLGRVQHRNGDPAAAEKSLQRSIEIDPGYLGAYGPLAHLAVERQRWDELLRLSDAMLRINPVFALGHYYKGGALLKLGDSEGAERALQKALSTPDAKLFPESHYMLGELYRGRNDIPLAAREYRLYAAAAPPGPSWENAQGWLQKWEKAAAIEPEAGKKKPKTPK